MKNFAAILLFFFVLPLYSPQCKKDKLQAELDKLPPITQEGKNTFGCLVNGKAFLPSGFDGKPNIHVVADPGYGDGDLFIKAYRFIDGLQESISLGSDSIRSIGYYSIKSLGKTSAAYEYKNCYIIFIDSIYRTGYLNISKYDLGTGILSGTFDFALFRPDCGDTIWVTNGRFDKKL